MKNKIYKKWRYWLAVMVLVIGIGGMSGCVEVSSNEENKEESKEPQGDGSGEKEPEKKEENDKASIEEQVLLDQDGIKITAKELTEGSIWGPELKVLVENTGEKSVTVQVRNMSVNGFMVEAMFSSDVAAGKSANDTITLMEGDLETAGITVIQNIEFSFHVFDSESWDTVFDSDLIYLATSADGTGEQSVDKSGQLVLEQEGISIIIKEADSEDSFWGADIYVYIENNSDKNITVQSRSVSINGFMVDPVFSCEVGAGKKAYDTITFLDSELTDNGIETIDQMDISFHIFETDSWNTILDSENINVTF